jgi:hypothetical protein
LLTLSSRKIHTVRGSKALKEAEQAGGSEVANERPVCALCAFRSDAGEVGKVKSLVLQLGALEAAKSGDTGRGKGEGEDLVDDVGCDLRLTGGEVHRADLGKGEAGSLKLTLFDLVGGGEGVGGSGNHGHLVGGGGEKTQSRKDGEDAEDGESEHHAIPIMRQRVSVKGEREKRSTNLAVEDRAVGLPVGAEDLGKGARHRDFDPAPVDGDGLDGATVSAVLEESGDGFGKGGLDNVTEHGSVGLTVGFEVGGEHFDSHWHSLVTQTL